MGGFLLVILAFTLQKAPTFASELLQRDLPPPAGAAELDRPITSYSALDDDSRFVIAYYTVESDDLLHELRVRSFDKKSRAWRSATFKESIGSVLEIRSHGDYLYVCGHSSPSASPLLVLQEDLELKRVLDGWPVVMLDDGRVVFKRSMVHFAPAHAEVLALYDPRTDRESTVYPSGPLDNERGIERVPDTADQWIDRSFSDIKTGDAPGTVELLVVTQRIRLNVLNAGDPVGREERYHVHCDLTETQPSCRRR